MLGAEDEDGAEDFLVMPENWVSVQVFSALNRCWKFDGFNGKYMGLDRPGIESTLRLLEIDPALHRQIFEDLRIMENAALESLNREQ